MVQITLEKEEKKTQKDTKKELCRWEKFCGLDRRDSNEEVRTEFS